MMMLALAFTFGLDDAEAKRRKKRSKFVTITHKIKRGDSFAKLAKKYRVSTKQLVRWNRKLKPTALRIGQKVRIAVPRKSRYARKKGKRRGKTLEQYARISKSRIPSTPTGIHPDVAAKAIDSTTPRVILAASLPTPVPQLAKESKEAFAKDHVFDAVQSSADSGQSRKKIKAVKGDVIYTVLPGENLGTIGLKFVVDVSDLQHWNGLSADVLNVDTGTQLIIKSKVKPRKPKGPVPATYRVKRGDSLHKISKKLRIPIKKLKRWNRKLRPRKMRLGQRIRYYTYPRDGVSRSVGTPNTGRLVNGQPLMSTPWLKVRIVSHAYGTTRVVRMIKAATADVAARWPESERLVVGDLSFKHGGRIKKHLSHRSGRDADISYYHRGNVKLPDFRDLDAESFDAAKNWHIFKTLIDTGEVQYIFVEYPLQRILFDYAKSIGYTDKELRPILQYPRARRNTQGIIRHVPGHDNHWHIRFRCGPDDRRCR